MFDKEQLMIHTKCWFFKNSLCNSYLPNNMVNITNWLFHIITETDKMATLTFQTILKVFYFENFLSVLSVSIFLWVKSYLNKAKRPIFTKNNNLAALKLDRYQRRNQGEISRQANNTYHVSKEHPLEISLPVLCPPCSTSEPTLTGSVVESRHHQTALSAGQTIWPYPSLLLYSCWILSSELIINKNSGSVLDQYWKSTHHPSL